MAGLTRLKERFVITTLSNGNVSLLTNMAKRAGLPWDCVISAELFHHYKPDPQAYLGCADLLGVQPEELMLVAAHPADLRAARDAGLRLPTSRGHWSTAPTSGLTGWTTANSTSRQQIFSTSPTSWARERVGVAWKE